MVVADPDDGFDSGEPHVLANRIAQTGEGKSDAGKPQFLDECQQRIAGAGIDEIHGPRVQKHVFHRWLGRRQGGTQSIADMTDVAKNRSPPARQISRPSKVIAWEWRATSR